MKKFEMDLEELSSSQLVGENLLELCCVPNY
jgi:hypothetical protein